MLQLRLIRLCREWIWTTVTYKSKHVPSILLGPLATIKMSDAGSLAECIAVCQHFPSCGSLALTQLRKLVRHGETVGTNALGLLPGVVEYSEKAKWCVAPWYRWIEPWTRMREGISCDCQCDFRGIHNIIIYYCSIYFLYILHALRLYWYLMAFFEAGTHASFRWRITTRFL